MFGERKGQGVVADRESICDVVVVGGGIAATVAACKAREAGADVVLVDKGHLGRSGVTTVASGVVPMFLPGDDEDAWLRGESNPLTNHRLLMNSLPQMEKLLAFLEDAGVRFVKDGTNLLRVAGARVPKPNLAALAGGGPQLAIALRAAVLRHGIRVVNRVMVTGLLTADGKLPTSASVTGCIGFDVRTAESHVFRAKAVIMACGPLGHPYAYFSPLYRTRHMPVNASAEGIHAMWEAGATLGKLEIGFAGLGPAEFLCAPGLELLTGLGGHTIWMNGRGERFMSDEFRKKEWGRSAIQSEMMKQYLAGNGPVGVNLSHFKPEDRRLFKQVVPIVAHTWEAGGYDLTRDTVPFTMGVPAEKGTAGAGARITSRAETSVPGLYAAGNCTDGAYICLGQTLTVSALTGWWAGESAAAAVAKDSAKAAPEADSTQVVMHEARYYEPQKHKEGLDFQQVSDRVTNAQLALAPTMNAKNLGAAREVYHSIMKEDFPRLAARDPRQLARIAALKLSLPILELVIDVMDHRTESRGNIVRDDHPYTDNDLWLTHTVVEKEPGSGGTRIRDIPVPEEWWLIPASRGKTLHPYFVRTNV